MDLAGHRLCASCNITGTIGKLVARAKCANPFLKGKSLPSSLLVPSGQIQILRLLFLTCLTPKVNTAFCQNHTEN